MGAGLLAVFRAYAGWSGRRPFAKGDNAVSAAFSGFMWLQVIVGLGLLLRPKSLGPERHEAARRDARPHQALLRHGAHRHHAAGRRAGAGGPHRGEKHDQRDTLKHKKAFLYLGIGLVLVLLMIPWGIWNPYRPLFRF
ncbi:MAG: hypothetical protein WKG07_35550 [Hymenobacter sp.]